MKVNGQLENAQFEQKVGAPTPTPTGRIYMDITAPLAAVPYVFNGTSWKQLAYSAVTTFVTQNSGKACTVDWSTGLNQQVVLTDNAVISFTNPQEGQLHNLEVKQFPFTNANFTTYLYVFNMADQDVGRDRGNYQPKPIPRGSVKLHQWLYKAGAVTAYNNNPSAWNALSAAIASAFGTPTGCHIPSENPDYLAVATGTTPFQGTFKLFNAVDNLSMTPFGGGQIASSAAAGAATDVCYTPNGEVIFVASGTSPFLQGFYTVTGAGAGTVFSNPGTLPAGAATCVDVHPTGGWVAVAHATSPFISVYPLINGAFGTKIANPATLPAGNAQSVKWSPLGDFIIVAHATSPFVTCYAWSISSAGVGTFGAKVADPATLPAGATGNTGKNVAVWRPQGDIVAVHAGGAIWINSFSRSTATFGANIPITLGFTAQAMEWTVDGQYLFVSSFNSGTVYDFATGLPVAVTNDFAFPNFSCTSISMHPSGQWGVLVTGTSNKLWQITPPNKQRNYMRLS